MDAHFIFLIISLLSSFMMKINTNSSMLSFICAYNLQKLFSLHVSLIYLIIPKVVSNEKYNIKTIVIHSYLSSFQFQPATGSAVMT